MILDLLGILFETVSRRERSPSMLPFWGYFRDLCSNLEADLKHLGNTFHGLAKEKVNAAKASSKGKNKGHYEDNMEMIMITQENMKEIRSINLQII